jgi:hypothetical protein
MSDAHHLDTCDELLDRYLYSDEYPDSNSDIAETYTDTIGYIPSPTFSVLKLEHEIPFPLMKLPPEIRLNVYDCLFTDLTINRQREVADLTEYHHSHEWPDNDFSAYRNLLLTCREVHDAAKGLWETMYARHVCFYFWKVPDFYRVAKLLTTLGEPYQDPSYALRTRTFEETEAEETEFVDNEAEEIMSTQPGFPHDNEDYANFHWAWPPFHFNGEPGSHSLLSDGRIPHDTYRRGARRRPFARAEFPGLEDCSIVVHEDHPDEGTRSQYLLMSGKIGTVFWGGYDAAAGHAQLKIWEEWRKRGCPPCCLAKAEVVLTWRAQAMSGQDEAWLALGGDPHADLENLEKVKYRFQLHNWLRD